MVARGEGHLGDWIRKVKGLEVQIGSYKIIMVMSKVLLKYSMENIVNPQEYYHQVWGQVGTGNVEGSLHELYKCITTEHYT